LQDALLARAIAEFDVASSLLLEAEASGAAASAHPLAESAILAQCAALLTVPLDAHAAARTAASASIARLAAAHAELVVASTQPRTSPLRPSRRHATDENTGEQHDGEPLNAWSGGSFIRGGYNAELDAARRLRDHAAEEVSQLQAAMQRVTGIPALRVKRTDDQGYFAEVPTRHVPVMHAYMSRNGAAGAGAAFDFRHGRTLKATARFKCKALSDLDVAVAEAAGRAAALEMRLMQQLYARTADAVDAVSAVARAVAVVDVSASLAELAAAHALTRPTVVDEGERLPVSTADGSEVVVGSNQLLVRAGRHLVVERALIEGWASGGDPWEAMPGSANEAAGVADDDAENADGNRDGRFPAAVTTTAARHAGDYSDRTLPATPAQPRMFVPNDIVLGAPPVTAGAATAGTGASGAHHAFHDHQQRLDAAKAVLLMGSNMGGKSTYLRQAAHMVVLAQVGSYVPADAACVGVVDRVFSRVGASDDVTRDRSTFLVEMEETAAILKHATRKSLVVIDEVGRGTSATDGLAIAWAVLEHLTHDAQCRTLFATHFHELTALALTQRACGGVAAPAADAQRHGTPGATMKCMMMAVVDSAAGPLLTHKVVLHPVYVELFGSAASSGGGAAVGQPWGRLASSGSYGLHVAGMAGVPAPVLTRARGILAHLDQSQAAAMWARAVAELAAERDRDGGGNADDKTAVNSDAPELQ
jgi:DNA mismatch repair ATPase MutS